MAQPKRQITEAEKHIVLNQQKENGILYCFARRHAIADETAVEFHHIKPYSDSGASEVSNIGAVCKEHHKRIRTLSLAEFRDQLEMEDFFTGKLRKLDDLLKFKFTSGNFARQIEADRSKGDSITLYFINPDRPPMTSHVYKCPATGMLYFYGNLPIEFIQNDSDLQPRPLERKRVWDLYRHLNNHTQLAPAVCRLVGNQIFLFDGQHKSAAQIWAGRRYLDCKIYIEPNILALRETNLSAHDKLRQMPFFTSTLINKYSDIFKQEWDFFVDQEGPKTELNFVNFLRGQGKTAAEAKKMLLMAIEHAVIESSDNKMSEFISERNRSRLNPLSISILQKSFFKDFILAPPTDIEFESSGDFREDERANLTRLMSVIAERQLVGRWNPETRDAKHQRAERIFGAGVIRSWVPILRSAISQILHLFLDEDRQRVFFRVINEEQWGIISGRIDRLFEHKIWDNQSPDVAARLKLNEVKQVQSLLKEHGLTVGWVLGSE